MTVRTSYLDFYCIVLPKFFVLRKGNIYNLLPYLAHSTCHLYSNDGPFASS